MHLVLPRPIADLPWGILFIVLALGASGVAALYSVAPGGDGSLMPYALPHAVRFLTFFVLAIALSYVRPKTLNELVWLAYAGGIVLLIVTLLLGVIGGGARSWLNLGVIRIQPSELMKPVLVLILARFYAMVPPREITRWSAIWPVAVFLGPPLGLILLQPDFGTVCTIILASVGMMFLAGLPLRLFIGAGLALAAAAPQAFSLMLPHQQRRVLIFLNPEQDPLGSGYHIQQSMIAIGSGGAAGRGYLEGTQASGRFLPEPHTDFIFAAIAEEWGLIGGLVLILLFYLLCRWSMRVALDAKDRFERLAAAGLGLTIFFYIAVNLMMVLGLAPVVGIPLPLVSWGGSAMMTVMICLGLLMAIDRSSRNARR